MGRKSLRLLYFGILFHNLISYLDSTCCKLRTTRNLGLVNYWPIDGNINDYFGTAHMYNLVNAELTADRFGNVNSAISFTDGYAQVPTGVYFSGPFSVMAWIKVKEKGNWARLIDFGNGPGFDNVLIAYSENEIIALNAHLYVNNVPDVMFYKNFSELNEWRHIAFVKSASEYKIYINGTLVHNNPNTVLARNLTRTHCYIGKSNWVSNSMANADMDDIKIFNVPLSDMDVKFHYESNVVFVV